MADVQMKNSGGASGANAPSASGSAATRRSGAPADAVDDDEEEDETDKLEALEQQEESQEQNPLMRIAGLKYLLTRDDALFSPAQKADAKAQVVEQIRRDKMAPYYTYLCAQLQWDADAALVAELTADNATELAKLDAAIADAQANAGESEVREGLWAKAQFFARIGDKERALPALELCFDKTVGGSLRIDVMFAMTRVALCYDDTALLKKYIDRTKQLVETGGDWERKNLLLVYESTYLILSRQFKLAATKLLDSIATFTCYELFPYSQFVFYMCTLAVVALDRVTLKKKVLQSPEILSVIDQTPHLRAFVFSLYKCDYQTFFVSLAHLTPTWQRDPFLGAHVPYYLREVRTVAYNQFLESYRTATLASMARSFGVSVDFIDAELFRFISSGRVNAKIDAVNGIVETNRPDPKNAQYADLLKHGDLLLNRVQKLTKVVHY